MVIKLLLKLSHTISHMIYNSTVLSSKLKSLGFSSAVSQEFLDDIFGKQIRNSYQEGLVDCCSWIDA